MERMVLVASDQTVHHPPLGHLSRSMSAECSRYQDLLVYRMKLSKSAVQLAYADQSPPGAHIRRTKSEIPRDIEIARRVGAELKINDIMI